MGPFTFDVADGDMFAIVGPNGSGKSTLLKTIAGLLDPSTGRVRVKEEDIHHLSRRRVARLLGYLPQEVQCEFDFTVEQVVAFGRFSHAGGLGFMRREDRLCIERVLGETRLAAFSDRPLSRLSGGERRRAFLGSVLAQEPQVLLLDEPTASLDVEHALDFFELLDRLAREGLGIVVVTHDLNLASLFAGGLLLVKDGQPVALGKPGEVLSEDNLRVLYGPSLLVALHPQKDAPAMLPRWRKGLEGDSR